MSTRFRSDYAVSKDYIDTTGIVQRGSRHRRDLKVKEIVRTPKEFKTEAQYVTPPSQMPMQNIDKASNESKHGKFNAERMLDTEDWFGGQNESLEGSNETSPSSSKNTTRAVAKPHLGLVDDYTKPRKNRPKESGPFTKLLVNKELEVMELEEKIEAHIAEADGVREELCFAHRQIRILENELRDERMNSITLTYELMRSEKRVAEAMESSKRSREDSLAASEQRISTQKPFALHPKTLSRHNSTKNTNPSWDSMGSQSPDRNVKHVETNGAWRKHRNESGCHYDIDIDSCPFLWRQIALSHFDAGNEAIGSPPSPIYCETASSSSTYDDAASVIGKLSKIMDTDTWSNIATHETDQSTLEELRGEIDRLSSLYKEEVFINQTVFHCLLQENIAYALKVSGLEQQLRKTSPKFSKPETK